MIVKSHPTKKLINGVMTSVTDKAIVSEREYRTNGESFIVTDSIDECLILLDAKTTDDITIKALSKTVIQGVSGEIGLKIDKQYDEIVLEAGSAITFSYMSGVWYIVGSDGMKQTD